MPELLTPEPRSAPTLCYIWGRVRPVVNAFAVAFARELNPDPYWIEVAPAGGPAEPDAAVRGRIPPDHLLVVTEPSRLAPADPMSSTTLGSLLRPEDRDAAGHLADFLRLPPPVRELTSQSASGARPGALVVANCDRLRPYYPGFAGRNRELLVAHREAGVSVVYTLTGEPAPDRREGPFDTVIEVEADSLRAWRLGSAIPERVPDGALLAVGHRRPLTSIPEVARLLDAASAAG